MKLDLSFNVAKLAEGVSVEEASKSGACSSYDFVTGKCLDEPKKQCDWCSS